MSDALGLSPTKPTPVIADALERAEKMAATAQSIADRASNLVTALIGAVPQRPDPAHRAPPRRPVRPSAG